ncbi:ImmA/IrrE family metallo-endopeptidase [Nocardioides eburneiflavus]|uniref:ImmA/IrrE family metallo-endopeptidase n=1 Tax=Nocardioides eburneiflavus TaxID=2518372 RepID=A0A4Z1CDT1_9ACTN|nr:ImmA/IrrE family metallo-endopeptidase [Nocardioides eburneiflavus]TGN63368.1 ImmA/IrrE family metallo-endopeptidase [Nocardioides eburneiflavus]
MSDDALPGDPTNQLERALINIVHGLGFDPPDRKAMLLPPQTRIVKSTGNDYKCFTMWFGGQATVRMGGSTYNALSALTRAAATFFVADDRGEKPSTSWPAARDQLASAIDWCASPARTPHIVIPKVTKSQHVPATAFAQYAYRFIICHELAHIVLEHRDELKKDSDAEDTSTLRASQQQELEADEFGFRMHVESRPQPEMLVTALASPIYFVYLLRAFDDYRLAALANLVDYKAWKIEYNYPPYLQRIFGLMGQAQDMAGANAAKGLQMVHEGLSEVVGQAWEASERLRTEVAEQTTHVIASRKREAANELRSLLERSPIGVLEALDVDRQRSWETHGWPFAEVLPPEFPNFLRLDQAERARLLA